MQAVILTPDFIADASAAGLLDDEISAIVNAIAQEPHIGDLMVGTGGARKRRFGAKGKGKRGGIRIVSYYAAEDVPIFLLAIINKGERDNLSRAERNDLKKELTTIADDYRTGQRRKIAELRKGTQR
jgi:mRNA-degrading endonuclease RelE of RelBE toxin-antitoxin system